MTQKLKYTPSYKKCQFFEMCVSLTLPITESQTNMSNETEAATQCAFSTCEAQNVSW